MSDPQVSFRAARPGSGTTKSATEFLQKKIRLEKQRRDKQREYKPMDASDLRDSKYVKVRSRGTWLGRHRVEAT